jgi:ferrochelatase
MPYDAVLLVSFGGPEGPDDVIPFLERVLQGKNVPRERMLEVAQHYRDFGGVSPINQQCRQLIRALQVELETHGPNLPIYWGNRNWHPLLPDTLGKMAQDGVRHALAYFTSTFSSYSGCRQYRENVAQAQAAVGPQAPSVDKLRMPFNHPGFIEPQIELLKESLSRIPADQRAQTPVLFCAHSIPLAMANNCRYQVQLQEASRLVAEGVGHGIWEVVFQSRSGPPNQPWLEPDVGQRIRELRERGGSTLRNCVLHPIGFVSDHMEVIYDLDTEAAGICRELGVHLVRSATVGNHPRYVTMIRELIQERIARAQFRPALGNLGPSHDVCPADCCLLPSRSPSAKS